jgi:MoaA/NifB/PqqE/SkfB family radical SAM enzyme
MFRLLGGEPFLTKDLEKYLHAAEELFPDSMRDVSTNGLLLTKREDILSIFIETGTTLVLSIHEVSTIEDEMAIISAIKLASRWVKKGLKFAIAESNENWRRFYRGEGGGIRRARFNIGILN